MSKPAEYTVERLWEDREFVLSRGVLQPDSTPVLVLTPALEQPAPETLRRLEYAYFLRHELDSAWAARPLALVHHDGRPALELEDPGGNLLEQQLGQPMEVPQFLRVAISVAVSLGRLHARGLIHRGLKPANVYVDLASGTARLIGMYMAPRLPAGRSIPAPPGPTDPILAYMAPEQTGRMNRSTDSRSDLYAYGVILYQMITGELPFTAKDPMEWIHCHLAIQPMAPKNRRKGIPEQISAIVMKLLAKIPEERYQTAAAVEIDLRECLEAWDSDGQIAPFPAGVHDIPDQLLISEKVYGRDFEIDALLEAFDRVASHGTPELVLVSGYSGIGKSTVVNELTKRLSPPRGLFASGKFDQHKGDIPYTTVGQAFQTLVRQILSKSDDDVSHWRDRFLAALGINGRLISNLLPELDLIVGKQPPVPDLPPQEAHHRFTIVFRRFLGAFARPEHPLALFLDDLQWADAGTLQLLEHLLFEPEVRHVLFIGAYRDNEVSASHPLSRTLEKLRGTGVAVRQITLAPFSLREVTELIMDSLHSGSDRVRPLAQLIHAKTGGNPFFTIQFFTALAEERLLIFDPETTGWKWNLEHIRSKGFTDNIAALVTEKLDRLPQATQRALKQLACLGSSAAMSTLSRVSDKSERALDAVLSKAIRAGLVSHLNGCLEFVHDRVQEAAYQLIPEAGRAFEHLRIGRLLLEHTPPDQLENAIFEIVNQLNRGVARLTSAEERTRLAELNLIAGKRAKAAAAYVSALDYLTISSELLGEDGWDSNYETAFAIALNLAECEFLMGQLAAADERLSRLSALADNHRDRAAVASLRVMLYTALNRSECAVEACLEYMRGVGLACPPKPTQEDVAQEYERLWGRLGRRTIEELVDLPPMTDPACRGTLEVLTAIVPPSWFTDVNLRDLLVARMVNLSLEHGNSEASWYAYAVLARTLGSHFGDYQTGYRFGTLSLELVDRRGSDRFKTRVYTCFGHHIDPWKHHLRHGREWLRLAFAAAPQAGDLTFAAYNWVNTVGNLLASGEPLSDVQDQAEVGLAFARRMGYGLIGDLITAQLRFIQALRGLTAHVASFDGPGFDEHEFERRLDHDPRLEAARFRYRARKLQAHLYAGDYASAAAVAAQVQDSRWRSQSFFEVAEYPFYSALALAGLYPSASLDERIRHLDTIVSYQKLLSTWARHCPENFACMEALVAAEMARIEGRDLDAERLYEGSLRSARENGFVHHEALANELAATFYLRRGLQTVAYAYLGNARDAYLRWGALGKVRQIDEQYSRSPEQRRVSLPDAVIAGAAERLDSAAIVKALQAISGEIVLSKLIETLMRIAVEHAGAERGLFLHARNNEPQIAAEAATVNGRVEVMLQTVAVTPASLPGSILQYVMRTRESVVLDDAAARNLFSDDSYLRRARPRSVLCMPILRQAEVVDLLYLENNLTTHAFTLDRITVLKLLASQAAISLENARLYADLRRAEALLAGEKRVLEMMSRGDWLSSILDALCQVAEESCEGWIASILLLDANGERLWHGAAPALSRDYAQAINGVTVGPDYFGPCAMAVCLKETVVIPDISSDARWPEYRALALENGLRASWSTPILSLKGEVLGSFGMFSRQPRGPGAEELDIIKQMTQHAGVAIQRSHAEDALRKSEQKLRASEQLARGQVEALTYSLDVLATAPEPEKFLGKMLSTICRLLTGQSASLWLFDEPTDSLILRLVVDSVSPVGFDPQHPLVQNPRSWRENPVIQELFFAAGPIVCEDVETDPRVNGQFREYFMPKGTRKFLAVPIVVGGQVRGMITVRHGERPPYRTEEVGLIQALSNQVMLAIRLTEVGEQSRHAAVLAERNRMARDVHDTLAQGFTGVIVQLEAAKYAISEGDRRDADRHLSRAGELARKSLSEARRSVHALRPQALERNDLWQALKGIIKGTTIGTTLHTTFETQGKVPVLPPAWQENLLRIGQEALSNTLKYAHARHFRTRLISSSEKLRLELRDDGDGFQVQARHDGVGLTGMRERAEEMGGKLKIVSSRGNGTAITAILPLNRGATLLARPRTESAS